MHLPPRRAFTLIELLVVITIIVVLLALLTPALDKAIYQAELAACGANQRGAVQAVVLYATSNKRTYPHRNYKLQTFRLALGTKATDDRKPIEPYMSLDTLLCPLDGQIDLDASACDEDTIVQTNYSMWWNWQAGGATGLKAMKRIGDRWQFQVTPDYRESFSLLIDDLEFLDDNWGNQFSTHPDADGVLAHAVHQNGQWIAQIGGSQAVTFKLTGSFWRSFQIPNPRGLMDRNFGFDDGSVRRYTGLRVPEVGEMNDEEGRFVRVSTWANNSDYPLGRSYVPID